MIEAGIPQQIALMHAAQNYAHGKYDERRTAPKAPANMNVSARARRSANIAKALDESLEGTVPASDPVAVLQSLNAGPTVSPQRTLS